VNGGDPVAAGAARFKRPRPKFEYDRLTVLDRIESEGEPPRDPIEDRPVYSATQILDVIFKKPPAGKRHGTRLRERLCDYIKSLKNGPGPKGGHEIKRQGKGSVW
jgi:hypothetical protein